MAVTRLPARERLFPPPQLSWYILGQLLGPIAMLTLLLTGVIWLVEVLPLLDLVINRGQSAFTFLYLVALLLPTLLVIIMPLAFFFATLFTLQRLSSDSELIVMAAGGYSLRQLAMPVLAAAAIVMAATYLCALYLMPAGQRALSDKLVDIRADMAGALLNEGEFNNQSQGLTVFIGSMNGKGEIHNILVHNSREKSRPVTYIAEKGVLAQTPAGTRLIMLDGTVEMAAQRGAQLQVLHFESYTLSLDQFNVTARASVRKINERYLGELLSPTEPNITTRLRNQFFAEAHNRLSQPLNCIAFALIALAGIVRGRRQRGQVAFRLSLASAAAAILAIAGYGIMGVAQRHPPLVALFYLLPALGTGGAILALMGVKPLRVWTRLTQRHAS